ncbi:MAG: dTDP-4-dehydrorhamnose reductase [Clostridia bacterium]
MILVTGAKGQVGGDVCRVLQARNLNFWGIDLDDFDLTNEKEVESIFKEKTIDALIHCAAYTAVDKAESEEKLCMKVNAEAVRYLAKNCQANKAKFLLVSTDYVFSGDGELPFETDGEIKPLSVYGKSKQLAEKYARTLCDSFFVVRTSWVFGEKNTNFINTMLNLSGKLDEVKVVCDQVGSPTYSNDLAKLLCDIILTDKFGVYHATNENFTSWDKLAQFTFDYAKKSTKVTPIKTKQYPTPAKRPLNSRLSKKSLVENGFDLLPTWQDAVVRYLGNVLL